MRAKFLEPHSEWKWWPWYNTMNYLLQGIPMTFCTHTHNQFHRVCNWWSLIHSPTNLKRTNETQLIASSITAMYQSTILVHFIILSFDVECDNIDAMNCTIALFVVLYHCTVPLHDDVLIFRNNDNIKTKTSWSFVTLMFNHAHLLYYALYSLSSPFPAALWIHWTTPCINNVATRKPISALHCLCMPISAGLLCILSPQIHREIVPCSLHLKEALCVEVYTVLLFYSLRSCLQFYHIPFLYICFFLFIRMRTSWYFVT